MNNKSNIVHLKREILVRIIQSYLSPDFEKLVDKIPFEMRPKESEVPYRCCIHKERAILRERTIAGLGFDIENDDDSIHLSEYARLSKKRQNLDETVLTVIGTACKGCSPNRIFVTELCQGCVARPCISSCSFGAIAIQNGKSVIDNEKCKNCTKCIQVCPYKAIVKICVPCEDSCPVNAIKKNKVGNAKIDPLKCINCGQCISSCPFGAVHEKSQIIDILKALKAGKELIAMIAPSITGQLPGSINQLKEGLLKAGFSKVIEVAVGADITAKHEAEDFALRMERKDPFMTTSCCKAYMELVKKHAPELKPYVSETHTPLHYTAELSKKENPQGVTVFISPCISKKVEGRENRFVDYVMSFEEMGSLFVALRIELSSCSHSEFEKKASKQGRGFGIAGGVIEAVKAANKHPHEIKPVYMKGLDKTNIRQLKSYARQGSCIDGNLIEVMSCPEGCVSGPCVLNSTKMSIKEIKLYKEKSETL